MCLTVPGKVLEIKNHQARILVQDRIKEVDISALSSVKIGDWLLATVDLAVKKISQSEAKEILDLLKNQQNFALEEQIDPAIKEILKKASYTDLNRKEILTLFEVEGKEKEALFSEADATRKSYLKDFICLHGIFEFSNYCCNNCLYCGLRRNNKKISRYRISPEEIVKLASQACNKIGYKMLVLQSGVDLFYSDKILVEIVEKIKARSRCFLFMSVGERSLDCYKKMKRAGADGILMRFETSNPKLYKKVHQGFTLKFKSKNQKKYFKFNLSDRLRLIKKLKEMGYYIASGFLIGLPGQTKEDIVEDILLCKKLKIPMITFGPFIPCQGTPLSKEKKGEMDLVYKTIAICRLLMKNARIPVTTAMETLDSEARKRGLARGANSLMFNLTPKKYAKDYKIYSNKIYSRDRRLEKLTLFTNRESWKMLEREFQIALNQR